jgi:copper chaperone CopZ
MQRVDGVQEVSVDIKARTATVVYDPNLTNPDRIGESSAAVGFPASVIEDRDL